MSSPCVSGSLVFTWSIRTPVPAPNGAVGFINAHQLSERQLKEAVATIPTKAIGREEAPYCRPIVAVNRSSLGVVVEIRLLSSNYDGVIMPGLPPHRTTLSIRGASLVTVSARPANIT